MNEKGYNGETLEKETLSIAVTCSKNKSLNVKELNI